MSSDSNRRFSRDRRREEERVPAFTSADPVRNFTLTTDERIRALTIGVPAFSARKRKIEDQEAAWVKELLELHDKLARKNTTAAEIARALGAAASAFRMEKINKLVVDHNRYYPIEANLPHDRHGNYLAYGRPWFPETLYTAERVLELVQAELARDE